MHGMKYIVIILTIITISNIIVVEAVKPAKPDDPILKISQNPFGVKVEWTEPDNRGSEILKYELQSKTGSDDWSTETEANVLSYLDETVNVGDEIKYKVRAFNNDGKWSSFSKNVQITIFELVNEIECGDDTTLTGNICNANEEKGTSDMPLNTAPHQRGGRMFQDMDNLSIYTASEHKIIQIFDFGSSLYITIKTKDPTVFVTYKDTLLAHEDTGFCDIRCPNDLQTFIFNVPIQPYLRYNVPLSVEPIQNGNWLFMCEKIWSPIE